MYRFEGFEMCRTPTNTADNFPDKTLVKLKVKVRDLRSFKIRFERNWPIRKFSNRIGRACSFVRRKLSQTTQTINGT